MSEPREKQAKTPGVPLLPPPVTSALTTSATLASFAAAFVAAQAVMTNAARSTDNTFFNTKYATLETVQAAVMPPLSANGIGVIQGVGPYGSITTRLIHTSGEWIECTTSAPLMSNVMNVVQAVGVMTAYLRRYSLMSMCGIAQVDDDGNGYATEGPVKRYEEPEPAPVLSLADAMAAIEKGTDATAVGIQIAPTVQFLKVAGKGEDVALVTSFRTKFPK